MRQAFSARGNVARLYLGMDRAIPYTAPYPASIGYHPGRNALIAIATDTLRFTCGHALARARKALEQVGVQVPKLG